MDAASEPTWMYSRRLQNNVKSAYFKLRGIEASTFRDISSIYPRHFEMRYILWKWQEKNQHTKGATFVAAPLEFLND